MSRIEFSSDGIRGIVDEWPFLSPVVVRIGKALGQYVLKRSEHPSVVIGRDTRPSGEKLLHCLTAGLTGQSVDVINLGVMTTPGVAFFAKRLEADLGVIVSASHSPLEYNGIKLVKQNGLRLQREEEIEVESLISDFVSKAVNLADTTGQETDGRHLIEFYIQDHVECCPITSLKGLRVVLDCADGATSRVAPPAFSRLGAEVFAINDSIEGNSINHCRGSEYVREHPQELVDAMQQHGASYGFAFDGDGDRLVVVDRKGRVFDGEDLLFILATHLHSKGRLKGNAVVTNDLANRGLEDALRCVGIQTKYTRKGDRNLETAMWGSGYVLGGEPVGNIIINDGHHTAADAVYTAIVLSGMLVQDPDVGLSDRVAQLEKRPQVTISFKLSATPTLEHRAVFQEEIRRRQEALGDGSRILIWDSSTEPGVFRVMIEGGPKNTREQILKAAEDLSCLIQQVSGSTD